MTKKMLLAKYFYLYNGYIFKLLLFTELSHADETKCSVFSGIMLMTYHFAGALFVLASLAGWVLWYSGNIDGLTSKRELGHIGSAVDRLARNLSHKIRTYRSQR